MCYFIPLICGWEFFPNYRGRVTGIIECSIGFGSFIFAQVSTRLVNPHGLNPTINESNISFYDGTVANQVPEMLRKLVIIIVLFGGIAALLVDRKERILGEDENLTTNFASSINDRDSEVKESLI